MSVIQQPILKDSDLDTQLRQQGYVVVPFLDTEEVTLLTEFYYQHHAKQQDGMYATAHVPDIDFRMRMNNLIKTVFARAIEQYFINHTALGGSFIAKGKGTTGKLHPHQDWNIVDEEQFRSFNIWVPLVDLHQNNGAIAIVPHSHNWLATYRSANITGAYSLVNDLLLENMVPLFMKKGEALIYDHRMLHASGENTTDEIRLAAVYGIIPDKSSMRYYHQADEKTVEVFESNPEFFLYGNIFEGPKGLKSLSKFEHHFPQVTTEQLKRFLNPSHSTEVSQPAAPSLFKRIKSMLGA
jgi:Phytanoyl-CoA dioxygenase (PhyH)